MLTFVPKAPKLSLGAQSNFKQLVGYLWVVNTSERLAKVDFIIYPAITGQRNDEIITEFDEQKLNSSIKLTRCTVRMSGRSAKSMNYSIEDQKSNYFLCTESTTNDNNQYMLRICALWTSLWLRWEIVVCSHQTRLLSIMNAILTKLYA